MDTIRKTKITVLSGGKTEITLADRLVHDVVVEDDAREVEAEGCLELFQVIQRAVHQHLLEQDARPEVCVDADLLASYLDRLREPVDQ